MAFVQDADDLPPQARTLALQASTTARDGQILTRPPGGNDSSFGNKSNCSKVIAGYFRYVVELVGVRKVPCADSGGCVVNLDGRDGLSPCTFKSKRETTDAVEK
jgi:hypothetical protein